MANLFHKVFGSHNDRVIKRIVPLVERIGSLEPELMWALAERNGLTLPFDDEHVAYEERLARMIRQYPHVSQFVDKRRQMLSVYTEKELKKWFETSGYGSPDLKKTDERQAARKTRDEEICRLQFHLQRLKY